MTNDRWHLVVVRILKFVALCITISTGARASSALNSEEAKALLVRSDVSRGARAAGIAWSVAIRTTEHGYDREYKYRVQAKKDDALVHCLAPARNSSDVILFNDQSIWFYKPGLRRPIAISARQKLVGQAANGDVASTQYARDYEIISVAIDAIDDQPSFRFDLKSIRSNTTYDKIRYWVDKKTSLGTKAEFMTMQGEVFKRATFEYNQQIKVDNKVIPFISKMIIQNAKFPENVSVLLYDSPEIDELPDSLFNVNSIAR